jgi:hypothetical protein
MPFNVVRDRVVAANLMRRHLTTGQRAMTAAALANMTVGGTGSNQHEKSKRNNCSDSKTNKDAADKLNVSDMSVKRAKAIKRYAPDLAMKSLGSGLVPTWYGPKFARLSPAK